MTINGNNTHRQVTNKHESIICMLRIILISFAPYTDVAHHYHTAKRKIQNIDLNSFDAKRKQQTTKNNETIAAVNTKIISMKKREIIKIWSLGVSCISMCRV